MCSGSPTKPDPKVSRAICSAAVWSPSRSDSNCIFVIWNRFYSKHPFHPHIHLEKNMNAFAAYKDISINHQVTYKNSSSLLSKELLLISSFKHHQKIGIIWIQWVSLLNSHANFSLWNNTLPWHPTRECISPVPSSSLTTSVLGD